ncbi:unnamed protein product, partial [marine sediment metagenome]
SGLVSIGGISKSILSVYGFTSTVTGVFCNFLRTVSVSDLCEIIRSWRAQTLKK